MSKKTERSKDNSKSLVSYGFLHPECAPYLDGPEHQVPFNISPCPQSEKALETSKKSQ